MVWNNEESRRALRLSRGEGCEGIWGGAMRAPAKFLRRGLSRAGLASGEQTLIQSALLREKRGMRVLMQEKSFGFESRDNRD